MGMLTFEPETINNQESLISRIKESTDSLYDLLASRVSNHRLKNVNNNFELSFSNSRHYNVKITKVLIDNQKELQALKVHVDKKYEVEEFIYIPMRFKDIKDKFAFGMNPYSKLHKKADRKILLRLAQ